MSFSSLGLGRNRKERICLPHQWHCINQEVGEDMDTYLPSWQLVELYDKVIKLNEKFEDPRDIVRAILNETPNESLSRIALALGHAGFWTLPIGNSLVIYPEKVTALAPLPEGNFLRKLGFAVQIIWASLGMSSRLYGFYCYRRVA